MKRREPKRNPKPLEPDLEQLVAKAEQENDRIREARAAADRRHFESMEAKRRLSICATYATPGDTALWVDPTANATVLGEQMGASPDWRNANPAFCTAWVEQWVLSVPFVRACIDVAAVEQLPLTVELHKITRALYVQLMRADDPRTVVKKVTAELESVRLRLRERRFVLQEFFQVLDRRIRRSPTARQLEREGRLLAELEPKLPTSNDGQVPAIALDWLITRTRLASVLSLGNPSWLKKEWLHVQPRPVMPAAPRSGRSSQYKLGELYESFRQAAAPRQLPPLRWLQSLRDKLVDPNSASAKSASAIAPQTTKKQGARRKAPKQRL